MLRLEPVRLQIDSALTHLTLITLQNERPSDYICKEGGVLCPVGQMAGDCLDKVYPGLISLEPFLVLIPEVRILISYRLRKPENVVHRIVYKEQHE